MKLKVLHKNKHNLEDCADILNEEWPRSKTARLHSLEKSCDTYPINLILVDDVDNVVGHSRLSLVIGKEKSCFVESVVVKRSLRGKGYGKLLMTKTEEFAKIDGLTTVYLSTHDKQQFYKHIGYTFCKPIVSCGAQYSHLPKEFLDRLASISLDTDGDESKPNSDEKQELDMKSAERSVPEITHQSSAGVPSPPPPPPPPTMVSLNKPQGKSQNIEISKWDPSKISWMKKDLA